MIHEMCAFGGWDFFGNFGVWEWIGLILSVLFWVGLLIAVTVFVFWAIRRARVPTTAVSHTGKQPAAKEVFQTLYARGEITPEQYKLLIQDNKP